MIDLTKDKNEAPEHDSTSEALLEFLAHFSQDTKNLLEGITLSGISEMSYGTRELWKNSTVSCPLVFGFQEFVNFHLCSSSKDITHKLPGVVYGPFSQEDVAILIHRQLLV